MNSLHEAWTVDAPAQKQSVSKRHRHWVVAPAVLLLMVSVMITASTSVDNAQVLSVTDASSSDVRTLDNGMQFIPDHGTQLSIDGSRLLLGKGNVLVSGLGKSTVTIGSGSVTGWNGGFAVIRSRDTLTVAAITTPVLVRIDALPLLVPMGMQWTLRPQTISGSDVLSFMKNSLPTVLPSDYRVQQTQKLAHFPSVSLPFTPAFPITVGQVLSGTMPSIDQEEQNRVRTVSQLRALTASGDTLGASTLLRSAPYDLFISSDGQQELSVLLALSAVPALTTEYLSRVTDTDLSLLLALHPATRTAGFLALDPQSLPSSDSVALLSTYPYVDTLPDAMPELVQTRWQRSTAGMLQSQPDILSSLSTELSVLHATALQLRSLQFADRLQRTVAIAHVLTQPWQNVLTDAQRAELTALDALTVPIPITKSAFSQSSSSAPQPLTSDQATTLTEGVRTLLISHAAMVTRDTSIDAVSDTQVHVGSIVFATAKGDELFSFTINPDNTQMSEIVRSGDKLSNPVSLDQFLEWISK